MTGEQPPDPSRERDMAIARWDGEGGFPGSKPLRAAAAVCSSSVEPAPCNATWVQLRVRVIALENILLVLLARASDEQLGASRARAAGIRPRPGFTRHALTIHAAAQMLHLVGYAGQRRASSREDDRFLSEDDGRARAWVPSPEPVALPTGSG